MKRSINASTLAKNSTIETLERTAQKSPPPPYSTVENFIGPHLPPNFQRRKSCTMLNSNSSDVLRTDLAQSYNRSNHGSNICGDVDWRSNESYSRRLAIRASYTPLRLNIRERDYLQVIFRFMLY